MGRVPRQRGRARRARILAAWLATACLLVGAAEGPTISAEDDVDLATDLVWLAEAMRKSSARTGEITSRQHAGYVLVFSLHPTDRGVLHHWSISHGQDLPFAEGARVLCWVLEPVGLADRARFAVSGSPVPVTHAAFLLDEDASREAVSYEPANLDAEALTRSCSGFGERALEEGHVAESEEALLDELFPPRESV